VRRVPVDAAAPAIVAPTLPPPVKPLPTPPPTEHVGPALVAPSAVTKLSGETPKLGVAKNVDMPSVVAAKVCIDPSGQVSSAELLTKLERHAVSDLVDAIRTWRYAPYKASGTPVAACFVVTLRVK
jgi:hypothetical protein